MSAEQQPSRAAAPGREERRRNRSAQRAAARAAARENRDIALPEGVTWQRLHPVTPLLQGWKIITAVLAIVTVQNLDTAIDAYQAIREHGVDLSHGAILWTLTVTGLIVALTALGLWLSWRMRTYAVDRDAVYMRSGVLTRQLRIARLPRIQSVDVVHPLLGRILGLGQLRVEVAGGGDSRVLIGYLRTGDLEELRDGILDLAAGAQAPAPAPAPVPSAQPDGEPGGAAGSATAAPGAVTAEGAPAGGPDDPDAAGENSAARAPLGFEDAATGERLTGLAREERPLYAVDTGLLLRSTLRSGTTLLVVLVILASVGGTLAAFLLEDDGTDLVGLLPALVGPLALVGAVWTRFNKGWGFRAAATPAGIRTRFGLTADTSSTLPPGRVHGVSLQQGPFWRGPDWWRVEVDVAGRTSAEVSSSGGVEDNGVNVLLPVGDRDTAERALWLVAPDLGTTDPDALLDAVLGGSGDDGVGDPGAPVGTPERGLIRVPERARIFSPIAWRHEGIWLTDTCVVLRLGRFWRRTGVIPYERIQSLSVHEGPLARRRGLGKLHLDMVDSKVPAEISNLDRDDLTAIERVIAERALRRRHEERLDRWLERVA